MDGNFVKGNRLMSLDALRGFDMFFITGGAALIVGLCSGVGCGDCWLARQMHHVPWAGLAHHDTIFPLFLFLAGVSWPFSLASQQAKGRTSWQIHRKVILRTVALFLIGLSFGGILKFNPTFRLMSVLGFIGLSWGLAALLFMHVKTTRMRLAVWAALVVGYFVLLHFGIAPNAPAGADSYSKEWNIVRWMETIVYPEHMMIAVSSCVGKTVVPYEPESLFSVPSGVSLALLGMMAGSILKGSALSPVRKAGALFLCGLGCLAVCLVLVLAVGAPIVKALWTTPFIFAAAAYSFLMLALFYWIVDVKGWWRWTLYFRVIGMNSILIYVLMMVGVLSLLSGFLFSGLASWIGAPWSGFVSAAGKLAVGWALLYFFYRKDIFLRV